MPSSSSEIAAPLRMDLVDWDATPEARWVTAADAPAGHWERHWHNPKPVTPLYADFEFGSHLDSSEKVAAEEFAAIVAAGAPARPRRLYLVIDGFVYRGEPAPGFEWGWLASADAVSSVRTDRPRDDDYEWQVLRRWDEAVRGSLVAGLRRYRSVELAYIPDAVLREHIRALSRHLVLNWALYFTVDAAAWVVRRRCEAFFQDNLGTTQAEFLQLLAGSSPATAEPLHRMDELARGVLANPDLRTALSGQEPWRDAGIRGVLAGYLEAFGHRASEWEYIGANLAERPERAVELLREAVLRVGTGQPPAAEDASQRRAAAVAALRRRLPDAPLRITFDRLLKDAQATFAIHEDNISLYMLGSGYMRLALLEAGARFAQRGLLDEAERVFFLRRGELESALLGSMDLDLRDRADVRWFAYQQQLQMHPPQVIDVAAPGEATHGAMAAPDQSLPDALLRGLGASAGIYTGRARVIIGEEQFDEVQPGEVLVCPQTSPTWTILFGRIGALVTDDGGILSHPAIAAREFGLPAVVSTSSGTRVLTTGQLVEVDGVAGTVRVVDRG